MLSCLINFHTESLGKTEKGCLRSTVVLMMGVGGKDERAVQLGPCFSAAGGGFQVLSVAAGSATSSLSPGSNQAQL